MTATLYTTGNLAQAAGACESEVRKVRAALGGESYGMDTPVLLAKVLEIAGLESALWALRCVPPDQEADRDRIARLFACDAAETVLHIFEQESPGDSRPRETIAVARRYASGEATQEELDAAWAAAWDAARDAARAAARAAAWAAARAAARDAARDAAWAAAWDAAWDAAWAKLTELFLGHLNTEALTPAGQEATP